FGLSSRRNFGCDRAEICDVTNQPLLLMKGAEICGAEICDAYKFDFRIIFELPGCSAGSCRHLRKSF
ncbi:unnamed protein product, partial [Sphenostylis stenocarpa]